MSIIKDLADLSNLATVNLEDQYGVPRSMKGAVFFGPINCLDNTNTFLFGVEIDQRFREAGWSLVSKNGATGSMGAFLMPDQHQVTDPRTGLPTWPNDAPLFEMNWVNDNSGDRLQGYNSHKTTPPALTFPWELGSPTWIPMGDDGPGTWSGIVGALGGQDTSLGSGPSPYSGIFPVGDYGGVRANDRSFDSNGFFMAAGHNNGAGKTWESQPLNGLKVRVHLGLGGINGLIFHGNLGLAITVFSNGSGSWLPLAPPAIITMQGQPDMLFAIDPYSFYLASRLAIFHADLYGTTSAFVTMINTSPAIPAHSIYDSIPTVALICGLGGGLASTTGLWFVGPPTDETFDGSTFCDTRNESGWCVEVLRVGPGQLLNKDGSDVMLPTRLSFSTDHTAADSSGGPMYYMGDMWNSFMMHRLFSSQLMADYQLETSGFVGTCRTFGYGVSQEGGSQFVTAMEGGTITINGSPYVVDVVSGPYNLSLTTPAGVQEGVPWSFGLDPTELPLPVTYKSLFGQTGGEEGWFFNGTQGQVFLATANYDYFDATYNSAPADPTNTPVGVKVTFEWNLFAKPHPTNIGYVTVTAFGGKAVNPDPDHYQPPRYSWVVPTHPLTDWSVDFGDSNKTTMTMSGPVRMDMIGIHPISITVQDTFGTTRTIIYNLVIGTPTYPAISQIGLPDGAVGVSYIATLMVAGGSGTLSGWKVVTGALPSGLSLATDTSGLISGIPTTSGSFTFSIIAIDDITGDSTIPTTFTINIS